MMCSHALPLMLANTMNLNLNTGFWWSGFLLVVGLALIVVCVALWIAVWAYVAPQESKQS